MTPDRQLILLARTTLEPDLFRVWLAAYVDGKGRRAGSLALGITEEAFRYRLHKADLLILKARDQEAA